MKDSEGNIVKDGDVISFSYGIPPVGVHAPIITDEKGELIAITEGHKPTQCKLKDLKKHVGYFYKVKK